VVRAHGGVEIEFRCGRLLTTIHEIADLIVILAGHVEIESPVGIVRMIAVALQSLAENMLIQYALGIQLPDLVDPVVSELRFHTQLVPDLTGQGKLPRHQTGVVGPADRGSVEDHPDSRHKLTVNFS
jgi:hypothetical protein